MLPADYTPLLVTEHLLGRANRAIAELRRHADQIAALTRTAQRNVDLADALRLQVDWVYATLAVDDTTPIGEV